MAFRESPAEDQPEDLALAKKVKRDNKTREAIIALEHKGRLTPEQVLAAAEDPASPLHDYFEWKDDVAAHAHRIAQARSLIRVVRLVVTVEETVLAVPRYVRDPAAGQEQGYVALAQLRQEPENARMQARYELVRALGYVERASDIAAALEIKAEVQNAIRVLQRVLSNLQPEEASA